MKKEALTFEKALETLETIVSQLEKGDLSLENALQNFEKGIVLSKECQDLLTQAELKIEQLSIETIQKTDKNHD
jgi:exodeoxyribonuclease VII small subunit